MAEAPHPMGFEVSFSARDDGTIEAIYVRFSNLPVAETREIDGDTLLADYDENEELVGIEILAPVSISNLIKLVDTQKQEAVRKFLQSRCAQDLVLA